MKKFLVLFFSIISLTLFAQTNESEAAFSQFRFFTNDGVNFNSVPTIGGSIFIGAKTNLSKNFRLSLSVGYASIFDDNSCDVKTYGKEEIEGETFYYTRDFTVQRVEYATIPAVLEIEYVFTSGEVVPFLLVGAGYSGNAVEEQTGNRVYKNYSSLEEIPDEYKTPREYNNERPFFLLGIGAGVEYNISKSFGLSFKYVFNYNDGIPNTNQFLVGVIF